VKPVRGQSGQSMVLAAILMGVLVGFTGLAIDGGEATARQQLVQGAADGASLTAAYGIAVESETEAAATTDAGEVLTADGLATSDLTLTFLDSTGAVTATPSLVANVKAVVTDSAATYFLGAVGIPTIRVTAAAIASTDTAGNSAGSTTCALCLMKTSTTVLTTGSSDTVTLLAPLQVNSNGGTAISLGTNTSVTATQVLIPSGGGVHYSGGATLSPAPTVSPAIADPFPTLAAPSIGGSASAYTAPAGASAISPGLYSTISVPAGATLTLNPGVYVITGSLTLTGGTVSGTGVTLYLACSSYPVACGTPKAGGLISVSSSSTLSLSPPLIGTYTGFTVFADRNDNSTSTLTGTSLTVRGTWYSILMPVRDNHNGDSLTLDQLIVTTFTLNNNDVVSFAGPPSVGPVGLST
jgi:Putative Flp pilus-assembly TadE/G-like